MVMSLYFSVFCDLSDVRGGLLSFQTGELNAWVIEDLV